MNNISIPVSIEDIKQACSNYETLYKYVKNKTETLLNQYRNTIVDQKLFGFIPWFKTTQYDKMKFCGYDQYSRELAILKLKSDTIIEVTKSTDSEPSITKLVNIVSDYFDYNLENNKHRYHINQYILCLELDNTVTRWLNHIEPIQTTLNLSEQAFNFVKAHKHIK